MTLHLKAGDTVQTCWADSDDCAWIAMLRGCHVSSAWKTGIPVPVLYSPLPWEMWGRPSPNLTKPTLRPLSLAHVFLTEKPLQTLIAVAVQPSPPI